MFHGLIPGAVAVVRIAVVAGLQALVAAILEERYALFGGNHGFRNKNGEFVNKWYAHARTLIGVSVIAFGVKAIAIISKTFFDVLIMQGIGLGMVLTPPLVHTIVDRYEWSAIEIATAVGGLALILAGYLI